jgi:hypothetical protein
MSAKRQIRVAFRIAVFKRDRYRCAMCGRPGKDRQGGDAHETFHVSRADLAELDAHHVTDRNEMPNGGYVQKMASRFVRRAIFLPRSFMTPGPPIPGSHLTSFMRGLTHRLTEPGVPA